MTDYVLESRCCGTKFADEKWELDCPNRDGAALIFANYAKKQLEVKENLPGLYKYSDWLPVCRTLDGSGAPVTYKSEGLAGELGLLDVVLGQNVSAGQKIGQINDLSDYKIEALIDEHYIDRVKKGLSATFERQGSDFELNVRKVYPEVRDGKFRTDFVFTGERPDNIRSGQTYYINLELGQPTESIIIPRGTFFQSTGGSWIFVLDKDGKKAYRRKIKIGRQNPQYYEVIDGLEAGEKVIVSSYESYKDNEVLVLE